MRHPGDHVSEKSLNWNLQFGIIQLIVGWNTGVTKISEAAYEQWEECLDEARILGSIHI